MDRFCQVSRSVPCPHARCEPLASHLLRKGNLFCACSSAQNNTFPLRCFFRFMVHLTFYGGLTTGQLTLIPNGSLRFWAFNMSNSSPSFWRYLSPFLSFELPAAFTRSINHEHTSLRRLRHFKLASQLCSFFIVLIHAGNKKSKATRCQTLIRTFCQTFANGVPQIGRCATGLSKEELSM